MIRSDSDSRLLALLMAVDGMEIAGSALRDLWRRASRKGRLERELRSLEENGLMVPGAGDNIDERIFRLTAEGRREVIGGVDAERQWSRSWDGKWRLVMFDVPQSKSALRERLRRKLRQMRFGWLQNSVWLSPDPLDEITRGFEGEKVSVESLLFLEARPLGGETDAEMVAGAWDFAGLEKLHASFLKLARQRPGATARLSDWTAWVHLERRAWAKVCRVDPFLPAALLPAGYRGREAWAAHRDALTVSSNAVRRLCAMSVGPS